MTLVRASSVSVALWLGCGALGLAGCSSDDVASAPVPTAQNTVLAVAASSPLRVDLIAPAINAVELRLGGPQRYFEISATSVLVNLYVATDNSTTATGFVFVNGSLDSEPAQEAKGNTFFSDAVDFDPLTVTDVVTAELATSTQDAFVIEGGPEGTVQYSIIASSVVGGQLVVVVGKDGVIRSVDPV